MTIKVAVIGAGSIGFTRKLMHDILAVPELADTAFHFMDISLRNLEMITRLAERDIKANNLPATITPTTNQREAVADSDYVIFRHSPGRARCLPAGYRYPVEIWH